MMMKFDRMMWLCGALFVLFGLPLAVLEDTAWRTICGGLSVLSLGLFALSMAADGLTKGTIRIQFSVIDRTAQPRSFWAAIAVVSAAGAGVIIAGIWVLFFKT
jgi:hypothetical protein